MATTTFKITAAPKFETAEGGYRDRDVTIQTPDGDRVTRDMCDPDVGWDSLDQWVSDKHFELLAGAGATVSRIVEIMHEAWRQTSYVTQEYTIVR
jgi:hypothetical protein